MHCFIVVWVDNTMTPVSGDAWANNPKMTSTDPTPSASLPNLIFFRCPIGALRILKASEMHRYNPHLGLSCFFCMKRTPKIDMSSVQRDPFKRKGSSSKYHFSRTILVLLAEYVVFFFNFMSCWMDASEIRQFQFIEPVQNGL